MMQRDWDVKHQCWTMRVGNVLISQCEDRKTLCVLLKDIESRLENTPTDTLAMATYTAIRDRINEL